MNCRCEQFHPNIEIIGMIPDGDDFLFKDEHETVWKLKRTHLPDIPFYITKISVN